jgi:hypothetical protein
MPLRKVVRLVQKVDWTPAYGSRMLMRELLECGHLFESPRNLHGTTIGDRKSRRCQKCRDRVGHDDLQGFEDL